MTSNPYFSYTKRDYENTRKEGIARIPILSKGLWTDLNAGDPGVVLLDYMCALADLCNYYLDHQALESFVATSKERANLIRHAQSVSYKVRSPKGAKVDVRFYVDESTPARAFPITIKAGTTLQTTTTASSEYLTTEDIIITESQVSYTSPCTQGTRVVETYKGTGISSQSTPSAEDGISYDDQSYRLEGLGADSDTIVVVDSYGTTWKPVDFLAFEESPDKVYQVVVSEDHRVTLKFGNGIRGYSPKTSDVLTIYYTNTDGSDGKIGPEDMRGTISTKGEDGNYYTVHYYNPESSAGGSYAESDEDLRRNIQTAMKTLGRAVTREDFENLAMTVDGVREVKVYDVATAPDLCLYHEVKVYILPDDTVSDNSALVNSVVDYLRGKSIPPTNVLVSLPTGVYIPVSVTVRKQQYLPAGEDNVYDQVLDCITDYFDQDLSIGESFNPYDLSSKISSLPGIAEVLDITPTKTTEVLPMNIARKGTVSIFIK